MIEDTINTVLSIINKYRFIFSDEKELQHSIEKKLIEANIEFKREHHLSETDIVDFFIDGVAFEIKIKGSANAIFRQLKRYAENDSVKAIVLISAKPMGLPETILDKPSYIYKLR